VEMPTKIDGSDRGDHQPRNLHSQSISILTQVCQPLWFS
jgi:hypothetical protein